MTPYTSPPGFHRHVCKHCGALYEHADPAERQPIRSLIRKHACPNCRAVALSDYAGEFAPDYTTNLENRCTG